MPSRKSSIVNTARHWFKRGVNQGSQFTSMAFTQVLIQKDIKLSMDGKGAWRDNVFVERVWKSVKYEEVCLRAYASVSEARASLGCYLNFYNTKGHIRSLTDRRRIGPTSMRFCQFRQQHKEQKSTHLSLANCSDKPSHFSHCMNSSQKYGPKSLKDSELIQSTIWRD